ncbi:MAG: nitrilase-related carbon-nitrogen hydrolase, partial [Bacteroidales bacterium]
ICFDWMFPEVCRTLTIKGAQIIAHPSNLVMPYCQNAMVTRCLENRVFAVTANRIGQEIRGDDDFQFTGKSQITCVNGNILSSGHMSKICVNTMDIDIHHADNKSINSYNDLLKDRRQDFYL